MSEEHIHAKNSLPDSSLHEHEFEPRTKFVKLVLEQRVKRKEEGVKFLTDDEIFQELRDMRDEYEDEDER